MRGAISHASAISSSGKKRMSAFMAGAPAVRTRTGEAYRRDIARVAKARATRFPPPLRGRDREGGGTERERTRSHGLQKREHRTYCLFGLCSRQIQCL